MFTFFKSLTPWWTKIIFKVLSSRLRLPYNLWRKIGIFKHGSMLKPDYAIHVFEKHLQQCEDYLPDNFSVLELGPGDSLSTALIASNQGASRILLVDNDTFASSDIKNYSLLYEHLGIPSHNSIEEMLRETTTNYYVDGLESLKSIQSNTVDFIFSQAVLEHIYLDEFEETINELFRIQKLGGISSHRIDFKDHLAKSLNSLRFSKEFWESAWFASSGFYTNRLRESQVTDYFYKAGYEILVRETDCWEELPLPRAILHSEFEDFSDEDLLIRGLNLIVKKLI